MLTMAVQSPTAFAAAPVILPAELGRDDGLSFGIRTTWGLASLLSAFASGYHGYKRHRENVGWTALWALGGAVFPVIVPVVALIQGFGKPARNGLGKRHRQRIARRAMKRYRRRRS